MVLGALFYVFSMVAPPIEHTAVVKLVHKYRLIWRCHGKGKAIPLQAWTGHYGCRRLTFPEFLDSRHMIGGKISPVCQPPLLPRKCPWCSFLLEADLTPGP